MFAESKSVTVIDPDQLMRYEARCSAHPAVLDIRADKGNCLSGLRVLFCGTVPYQGKGRVFGRHFESQFGASPPVDLDFGEQIRDPNPGHIAERAR